MMKNGLINMFSLPITDHEEIINVQDYRRRSIKILEITYYETTGNTQVTQTGNRQSCYFKKLIDKRNIPPLERLSLIHI